MRVAAPSEMREIDRRAIEEFGVPAAALMESAGGALARQVAGLWPDGPAGRRIHILCGGGNNGGDGFVAARWLANQGARVRVHLVASVDRLQEPAASFYRALGRMALDSVTLTKENAGRLHLTLGTADAVVDALLGTGIQGPPRGLYQTAIEAVNESGRPVVAADVPSGVDAETGSIEGAAVRATVTVTFGLPKLGLLLHPGASHVGRLVVADIGLPRPLLETPQTIWLLGPTAGRWVPERPVTAHKGAFGRVLVVAGSKGMMGAAALTAEGALRVGAGLCRWAGPASLTSGMLLKVTEITAAPQPEEDGALAEAATVSLLTESETARAVAIGPGLGSGDGIRRTVCAFLAESKVPAVVDADALNALAAVGRAAFARDPSVPWIMTPHAAEMARLLGCAAQDVEADRLGAVRRLAEQWQAHVALKGAPTLIASPDGRLAVNGSGNAGLATAGSGDVLTGAIAGLLAQGVPPFEAACLGVYLHGAAGDRLRSEVGASGWLAGDLARALPAALQNLREMQRGPSPVPAWSNEVKRP